MPQDPSISSSCQMFSTDLVGDLQEKLIPDDNSWDYQEDDETELYEEEAE